MIQLSGRFVPVKLNGEKEGAKQDAKFGVQGFPTILFIDGNEQVVGRIGGYEPPAGFARDMQDVLDSEVDLQRAKRTLTKKPRDFESLAVLADVYCKRGDLKQGASELGKAATVARGRHSAHLGNAYLALGMALLENHEWARGLPYLAKAEANATDPGDLVMIRMNMAVAYLNLDEGKKAISPLEKVLANKNLPSRAKQQAESMLADAKR